MERQITLTLDKAKQYYRAGGELKNIALSVYTVEELLELDQYPRTWEEYLCSLSDEERENVGFRVGSVPACLVNFYKLMILRDHYRRDWTPSYSQPGVVVKVGLDGNVTLRINNHLDFLSFPSNQMADKFRNNFRDLILKCQDLI